MNYRVNSIYNLPFHINVFVDETAPTKIEVTIKAYLFYRRPLQFPGSLGVSTGS